MKMQAPEAELLPRGAIKFAYASGSRPLPGYTIKRGLGRGGFGEVYQAVSDGGKVVALKHVQRHLEVELRGVGQCLNAKSPHLVEIIDIRQTPGEELQRTGRAGGGWSPWRRP